MYFVLLKSISDKILQSNKRKSRYFNTIFQYILTDKITTITLAHSLIRDHSNLNHISARTSLRNTFKIFLPARQISNMDKSVVERGINVSNAENFNTFTHLRSKLNLNLFGFLLLSLTWGHFWCLNWNFQVEKLKITPLQ